MALQKFVMLILAGVAVGQMPMPEGQMPASPSAVEATPAETPQITAASSTMAAASTTSQVSSESTPVMMGGQTGLDTAASGAASLTADSMSSAGEVHGMSTMSTNVGSMENPTGTGGMSKPNATASATGQTPISGSGVSGVSLGLFMASIVLGTLAQL